MTTNSRKPSLFALKMQKRIDQQTNLSLERESDKNSFGDASAILSGPEASDIHKENVQKLTSMSDEELLNAKNELINSMDGKLIEFLKSKRNNDSAPGKYNLKQKDSDRVKLLNTQNKIKEDKIKNLSYMKDLVNNGLNMDVIEEDKLGWTGDLNVENQNKAIDVYAARFGLDGKLLPYIIENKTTVDGLHHHGEEQHRPGYTIDELYSFLRKNHAPQRILALDVLSKLINNACSYDSVLDKPLLCSLTESGMFVLLRMALDDTNIAIITNALKAIGNLFSRKTDRTMLSGLSGCNCDIALPVYIVPDAEINQNELDKSSDFDLIVLDLVHGALRTDLILRLQYIVFNMNIGSSCLLDITEILTGIASRGEKYAFLVVETNLYKHLYSLVFTNLHSDDLSETFVFLTRVISSQSVKCALKLLEMKILDSIFKYINNPTKTPLLLECLYLWQTFFEYKLAGQTITEVANLVLKFVDRSVGLSADLTKTDLSLMSASLSLIDSALRNFGKIYIDPVYQLTEIILARLLSSSDLPDFETSKLIGNCFSVLSSKNLKFDSVSSKAVEYLNKHFGKICEILYEKSWLMSNYVNNSPKCYPSLGFINISLNGGEPLFMLIGLMKFLCNNPRHFNIPKQFWTYLNKLMKSSIDVSHWYCRYEIIFLINILKTLTNVQFEIEPTHKIAIALMSFIPKHMAEELYYTLKLYFNSNFVDSIKYESNFEILKSFYELLVPNNKSTCASILITELEPILPKDWLFLPILKIHETPFFKSSKEGESLLKESLANVLFMETHYPEVCEQTPLAARYCRVACTFMCGRRGTIFHEVKSMLNQIWHVYAAQNDNLNFKDPIQGVESFYDFYKTLCEHYVSVSYSDTVFGAYVLLPLQRKHSVELRKLVWSEIELPQTINIDEEHLDRIPLHNYTQPVETNKELLKMYTRVMSLRRKFIMYHIAIAHLNQI
ncbi:RNA polymerase II-associated protein 1 [Myzus persicae]|uniref:RNA polymerase II-associated protein 1 n=1 Tax=Myzus persicae TaxID=13164 RepID=UPI000B933AFB|nr:RNA polymerase II-associated protein 1 [Myzus persicae]